MSREKIYLGRENTIEWQLQADDVAVDLTGVTRMIVDVAGKTIDSDTDGNGEGNPFYWTTGAPAAGVANLILMLGIILDTEGAAVGHYDLRLTVYALDYPDGLVWTQEPVQIVA